MLGNREDTFMYFAAGDIQRPLVGNATADAGGVVFDVGSLHRGGTEGRVVQPSAHSPTSLPFKARGTIPPTAGM
jgi:hypothetical protein